MLPAAKLVAATSHRTKSFSSHFVTS